MNEKAQQEKEKKILKDKIETSSSIALQMHSIDGKANDEGLFGRLRMALKRLLSPNESFKESLDDLIEEHEAEGEKFDPEEKIMLHNVLAFGDLTVGDIMTPRVDIAAVSNQITLDELKKFVIEKQRTRIPVYRSSLDDIIGFIHIKDLMTFIGGERPFVMEEIIRKILFIPTSMEIILLLARMRSSRMHMAIVVDEYGGTTGLVTMEDLMEEIVGEIKDEHDDVESEYSFQKIANFSFEVSPRMPVDMLEEKLDIKISTPKEREDYDTVGGLIFFNLGRVPKVGEVIQHRSGIEFAVIDADARKIKKLLIKKGTKPVGKSEKSKVAKLT